MNSTVLSPTRNNGKKATLSSSKLPMTHRSYSVADTKSPGAAVKEYERFFSDMELEFGPGIVDRLKSKFTTSSSGSHSYSVQGASLRDSKEQLYAHTKSAEVSPVPLKPSSTSPQSTNSSSSRKLDGILQHKTLMNENVIVLERGGGGSGSIMTAVSTPNGKYGHPSYNTVAADLVNNSECIEGLVSQYKAIFDAKEPVPTQRRKRMNAPGSALVNGAASHHNGSPPSPASSVASIMTTASEIVSTAILPPVPPPRPRRVQLSTAQQQNSKTPKLPPRPASGPLGAPLVPLAPPHSAIPPRIPPREVKDTGRTHSNGFTEQTANSSIKSQATLTGPVGGKSRREPPPRPENLIKPPSPSSVKFSPQKQANLSPIQQQMESPKSVEDKAAKSITPLLSSSPKAASFDFANLQASQLGSTVPSEDAVNNSVEVKSSRMEKTLQEEGSRLGVEGFEKPPRPTGRLSLDAQKGSLLEASKIGVEMSVEVVKVKLEMIAPANLLNKEEVDGVAESKLAKMKMADHEPVIVADVIMVDTAAVISTKIPEKTDAKVVIAAELTKVHVTIPPVEKSKATIASPVQKPVDSPLPNTKRMLGDRESQPVKKASSPDSEKENNTPKRVTLKKTANYGMTTIIDTKSRPISPSSPALKIDDPALLTSLRDIGLGGGGGGRSGADGAVELELELLKMIVVGHNSPTGSRSSLKSAGNSRSNLRITFNDSATKTHEYPSERSLLTGLEDGGADASTAASTSVLTFDGHDGDIEESDTDGLSRSESPMPAREGDLLRKPSPLSRPSLSRLSNGDLSSYKPSSLGEFQLGLERPHFSSSDDAKVAGLTTPSTAHTETTPTPSGTNEASRPLHQRQQASTATASFSSGRNSLLLTDSGDQWCVQSGSADDGNFSSTAADDLLF